MTLKRVPMALIALGLGGVLASTAYAAAQTYDHVVVVVMENHTSGQVINNPSAPYITSLSKQGANLTNSRAVTHPSQPNYLALFSGSTQGVTSNACPLSFSGPNLAAQLIAAGKTFAGYSEGLPSVGSTVCSSGAYVRKHNPWVNFTNVPASVNLPQTAFPSDYSKLPTVAWVIPNLDNDMHDGSVSQGDTWLKKNFDGYAQWAKTHNSLLIVTFDEDDYTAANIIPTVVVGAGVKVGNFADAVTHYGMLSTIEAAVGIPQLTSSPPLTSIFTGGGGGGTTGPIADFSFTTSGLKAVFTDLSKDDTGTITSYAWDFGDKSSSTSKSPSHTYAATGTYSVVEKVTDSAGKTSSKVQQVTISAPQKLVANFTYKKGTVPHSIWFTDTSTDSGATITKHAWSFGDGKKASTANPHHTFPKAGTYLVTETVSDSKGANDTKTISVVVK